MKKKRLLFLGLSPILLSATFTLYGQARYEVKGRINGVRSGTISFSTLDENNHIIKTIDSGAVVNNSFDLKGKIETPEMVEVKIKPGNWEFRVFMENSNITITADTAHAVHRDNPQYGGKLATLTNFTVDGSRNFDDWMSYQNDPHQKAFEQDQAAIDKSFKAAEGNDSAMDKAGRLAAVVYRTFRDWQKNYISDYVSHHPSSVAGVYMLYDFYTWLPDERVTLLNTMLPRFAGEATSSTYFAALSDVSAKLNAVQPGSTAPDFTLLKRDSTRFNLTAFAKGNYTMIDFWASWCGPCRQMIPYWKTVYQKYHTKGFQMVSVSADSRYKDWVKYMDVVKMPWEQVIDDYTTKNQRLSKVMNLYEIPHIPYYLLLDKNGKIVLSTSDGTIIDDQLKKIYGE